MSTNVINPQLVGSISTSQNLVGHRTSQQHRLETGHRLDVNVHWVPGFDSRPIFFLSMKYLTWTDAWNDDKRHEWNMNNMMSDGKPHDKWWHVLDLKQLQCTWLVSWLIVAGISIMDTHGLYNNSSCMVKWRMLVGTMLCSLVSTVIVSIMMNE